MKTLKKQFKKLLIFFTILGPGLITAFADNDAGGVATYSVAASQFGYDILFTLLPITVVLMITQEIGSRIAVVTRKGLADLIRERYGIKISLVVFTLLFFVNFGVILQNIGGFKSALQLFNLDYRLFLPLLILFLFLFLIFASYQKIERFFLFLILFYVTYLISAILAKPDWGLTFRSMVIPPSRVSFTYIYTAVAVLGTTVTGWGQFFINSYVKDKKITLEHWGFEKLEVFIGSILTNVFTLFMMVAVAATIFQSGIAIQGASDAALAIRPVAGDLAGILFGFGLLIAGFLGCAIVPLATAYAFSEFFGFAGSLDSNFKKSRLFYGFFLFQILLGTVVVLIPNFSLFQMTLYADFINGLFLPVIFFFLYKFANNEELMGKMKNTKLQNMLLISCGIIISLGAFAGAVGKLFNL